MNTMPTLPAGWTHDRAMACKHVGAAMIGDSIEEGKAVRAYIEAHQSATTDDRFGPALIATSVAEMEQMKAARAQANVPVAAPAAAEKPARKPRAATKAAE